MKRKARLLIVDDEPNIRKILQAAFERAGMVAVTAESGEQAEERFTSDEFDVVLSDVFMPGMSGVDLLQIVKSKSPNTPVIIMTAFGTIPQAVEAMRLGAADYISKPFDLEQLRKLVAFWVKTGSNKERTSKVSEPDALNGVVYRSEAMAQVIDMVSRVADSRASVLLTGESGTGKEVIAKLIHRLSPRATAPFVAINCAAIPETLLESELFGHEKGAFTGADSARQGRFEAADGGTLFLDEVGEIPTGLQVKLLRVLQEREFERLGASVSTKVDVRLVAATNRDLHEAVGKGSFRQDLLYRLEVLHIELPPLRARVDDIEPLAYHFLEKFREANSSSISSIDDSAMTALLRYSWPGNVRELENVIERAVVLAGKTAPSITLELLPAALKTAA
jgi:DNA-binding NtrC family response regulator